MPFLIPIKLSKCITVWKFHDFAITQILREINLGNSRSAKYAILTHSETLDFDFYEFLHFFKAENHQILIKFKAPKNCKNDNFKTSIFSPKLISRKIFYDRKFLKFTLTLFWQKFRESNIFTKEMTK